MQNYRNNAMPYNTYRQSQMSSRMNTSRMNDNRMEDSRMDGSCMTCRNTASNMSLAMAYVPWQNWRDVYDAEKGFHHGTIFQELNKPFLGKGGSRR